MSHAKEEDEEEGEEEEQQQQHQHQHQQHQQQEEEENHFPTTVAFVLLKAGYFNPLVNRVVDRSRPY